MDSWKRIRPDNLSGAFSSGMVTATGERIFIPLRKRGRIEGDQNQEAGNGIDSYTDVSALPSLSEDDIRLIRLQNRIEIEGDDIVGPIQKFTNIGLQIPLLRKLASKGITVGTIGSNLHYLDAKTCSNARSSIDYEWKRYCDSLRHGFRKDTHIRSSSPEAVAANTRFNDLHRTRRSDHCSNT